MNKIRLFIENNEVELTKDINFAIDIICDCYRNGGKLLLCGNGGSCSDCGHILGELMKSFMFNRPLENKNVDHQICEGIPVIDLTSNSGLITALANDVSADVIFSQQVYAYSKNNKNDVLICLSTSGNSKNVVNASNVAKELGLKIISFTGEKDSELSSISTVTLRSPAKETFRVQEYHLPIYHYICQKVEEILFK